MFYFKCENIIFANFFIRNRNFSEVLKTYMENKSIHVYVCIFQKYAALQT